jgi:hypothetical protein
VPEKPRRLGETLALTGGPSGGDWKWAATSLQLGATMVQAQHGHGTGEPCGNCTCGRKTAEATLFCNDISPALRADLRAGR